VDVEHERGSVERQPQRRRELKGEGRVHRIRRLL
jgi:hypothetical protein